MAGSAASCVKDVINRSPFIYEMLIQEVISFSNLAQFKRAFAKLKALKDPYRILCRFARAKNAISA